MSTKRKRDNSRPNRRELSSHRKRQDGRHYTAKLRAVWQGAGPFLKRNRVTVKASLIFAASILAFMLIYSQLTGSGPLDDFRSFTAHATGFVLNLFGGDVDVEGTTISSPDFTMGIIEACTGIVPMIIFISAVLAYPASIKQRAIAIALGVVGLFAVNLIRTTTLFVIGTHAHSFFDTAHYVVWQSLMILTAVAFWLLWVMRLTRVAEE